MYPFNLSHNEQIYEQQEQQQSYINALVYTGRMFETGRDMRDQYCRGDYNSACASAEQFTENSLNALAELNGGLPDDFRNHTTLVNRKKAYCPDLQVSNNSLKRMQKAYRNRYPNPYSKQIEYHYTQEQAKNMIIDACKVGDYAFDTLNISLTELFEQFGTPSEIENIDSLKLQNLLFNGNSSDITYSL